MSDSDQTVFGGRYELHRRLARGGMADVYLAHDRLLDRPVAVKVLFAEFASDPSFVERFRREAQAAANLNHPNIVGVYDWGQEGNQYYIVMEYIDGRSLAEILRAEGSLLPERAADIGIDVAAALGFAHRNGVVNRDVKPGNILISSSGQVKVTDFGIARAFAEGVQENLTQAGSVMGTATYFSPEQAQGKPVDPRSDVYSLGVVLYEMVCGRPPFTGDSPVAIAYKHVQEPPAPLRDHKPDIDPALDAIVLKAMAKSTANRYPSAEDLRSDLRRYREGQRELAAGLPAAAALAAGATMAMPTVAGAPDGTQVAVAPDEYGDYDDQYVEEPRRNGVFVMVLVILLILLVGLLFGLARALGFGDSGGDEATQVEVPNVIDKNVDDARSELEGQGFEVLTEFEKNADRPDQTVFDQNPKGGEKVDEGSIVTLKVSTGAETIPMPQLVGLTEEAARKFLTDNGFTGEVDTSTREFSDTIPEGQVTAQDPGQGVQVPLDATITLTVSDGPEQRAVPDVTGKSAVEATSELVSAGFKVTESNEFSSTVPQGQVIATDPVAGTLLDKDAVVTIRVSQGIEQVVVPAVVGLDEAEASSRLTTAGFKVSVEDQLLDDPDSTEDGQVLAQNPAGDSQAPKGATVIIIVGRAPDVIPPDPIN